MNRRLPDVVLLHHQYGPYHVARAHALQARFPGRVHFVQLTSREELREWHIEGPAPEILTVSEGLLERTPQSKLGQLTCKRLDELRPGAVVIAGYSHAAMRAAATWCRRENAAAILLSDSHAADRPRRLLKEWAKRAWVSRYFDAAFTAGTLSSDYARGLGFSSSRIWRGYDVVDNEFFTNGAKAARREPSALLRELNLPERVFLFVGRFSAEKNLHGLLDAMEAYRSRAKGNAWGLLLVGGGPEQDSLAQRVRTMHGSVALTSFRHGQKLVEAYSAAEVFILPSTSEPWGLVVNEAMACGLPVLVSDRAGSAADLVFPGINGYVFDPKIQAEIVDAMLRVSSGDVDRRALGEASRRIIANYTPQTWADSLTDAIEVTLARRAAGA